MAGAPTADHACWSRSIRARCCRPRCAAFTFATSSPTAWAAFSMRGLVERRRGLEERVVQRPELLVAALRARLLGGERGRHRLRVERERVVLEDEADLAAVRLLDLLHGGRAALAERALEVGRLDDGHERVGRAARRRVVDRHLVDGLRVLGRALRARAPLPCRGPARAGRPPPSTAPRPTNPSANPTTSAMTQLTCFMDWPYPFR